MGKPILEPSFWAERLERARRMGQLHRAVFETSPERWRAIEEKHREILARHIQPTDSVLDAGCGWGRLLDLMPKEWEGRYVGVDLSPDFIELGRDTYGHVYRYSGEPVAGGVALVPPWRHFSQGDLRSLPWLGGREFDWAVLTSIRPMVKRELGDDVWAEMERELRRVARKLLYLEYDPNDEGSVE